MAVDHGQEAAGDTAGAVRNMEAAERSGPVDATFELTLALTLTAIIFGLVVQFLMTSAHAANNLRSGVTIQTSGQYGLDLLSEDIQSGDLCLASYTTGTPKRTLAGKETNSPSR